MLTKTRKMKVLVACEFSGIVRDAFAKRGHEAWSCDLLPSESPDGLHYQGDVLGILDWGWDLMIAHPPCTDLAVSGARWFAEKRRDGRQQRSIDFFMRLADAKIPKKCIENPVCIMSTVWRKPDQIIQPWMFGDDAAKTTCLWLESLPRLAEQYDDGFSAYVCDCGCRFERGLGKYGCPNCCGDNGAALLSLPEYTTYRSGKRLPKWYDDAWKHKDFAIRRSRAFPGIANAMAEQWGGDAD
jgi:hypothetical protein